MNRLSTTRLNSPVHRERDSQMVSRLVLWLFCGLILAGGFVFAAGQHFAAVQYGYKREELRQEKSRLLEERRRLLLEREEAAAPARLEGAARGLGLQPVAPSQITVSGVERGADTNQAQTKTSPALVTPAASLYR